MQKTKRTSLFLVELIVAILFFSLSVAVCIRLFSVSHLKSKEAEYRDIALIQAQNFIEFFKINEGDSTETIELTYAKKIDEDSYICYFNSDLYYSKEALEDGFNLAFDIEKCGNLTKMFLEITHSKNENSLIKMTCAVYSQIKN